MKYSDIVSRICGEDWETVNEQERDGGYGVAMMIAFLNGEVPNITAMATHLGVAEETLKPAFERLLRSGLFSWTYDARNDVALNGNASYTEGKLAWGVVAGVAGGIIERNVNRNRAKVAG